MKQLLLCAVLMIAAVSLALGQAKGTPGGGMGNDEQAIAQIGREWINAEIQSNAAKIGEILADDFKTIDQEGKTHNKSEYLNQVKQANAENKLTSFETTDAQTFINGDMAVWAGRYTMKFINAGKSGDGSGRYVGVSMKRQGRWRPVFVQLFSAGQQ